MSIAIGGAMANTFLYAKGINVGISLYEKDLFQDRFVYFRKS